MVLVCDAQSAQERFACGNRLYEQREWGDALRSYEAIEKKGGSVWYNMGNCWYKQGDALQAILCWKRAMPGASTDMQAAITKNIGVAYEKLGYKKDGSVYTMFEQWAHRLAVLPLQLLFLLCWYALLLLLLFGARGGPPLWYVLLLVLLCCMVLIGTILYTNYRLYAHPRGHVVREAAALFAGPHAQYHEVGTVSLADELCITEKRAGWYKVASGEKQGWIPSASVALM